MTLHRLTRPWRTARVATAALALTAAALTVSGSASLPTTSQAAPGPVTSIGVSAPCLTRSGARVRADSALDGVDPNTLTLAQSEQVEAKVAAKAEQRGIDVDRASLRKTTIKVYVHVITTDDGKGGVSKKRIKKQIKVLNKAYAGKSSDSSSKSPFKFKLKHIDKTKNSEWYDWTAPSDEGDGDDAAKEGLHKGTSADLNIYTASLTDGLLGYATFPFATTLPRDGVVLLNESLPGGSAKTYNKGDTATHEIGHWLGLYHTFQNGCDEPGDFVDDTPYQADGNNIFSCDKLDTCPATGKDPVHNFMSYGDDKCLDRFTKGQVARMSAAWEMFRAPGASA